MRYQISLGAVLLCTAVFLGACERHRLDSPGNLVPLTVEEDPTLPAIEVNQTLLHAETFGNQNHTMLVVLHGGPGVDYRSMLNYSSLANEGYFVVFYDQRGSGLSKRHPANDYSIQIFIDDLDAVIKHYKTGEEQSVVLLGHSWGAMLATAYINQNPEAIKGAVLTEPGGFTWENTLTYIEKSRALKLFGEGTNDVVYVDQFITGDDHQTLDYKMELSTAGDNNVGDVGPVPFWRYGAICSNAAIAYAQEHSFDFTTQLANYPNEVLFGYSELNPSYGSEHADLVSSAYGKVRLVEVKGTGHEIPLYGWHQFKGDVIDYLQSID